MCVKGLCLITVLSGLAASGMLQVSGMRIYTSGEVEAVNGTDVRLKCTFKSSSPINPSAVVISWTFRPLKGGREESIFHYQQKPYPPLEGIFRKHIAWDGDVVGSDASIIIRDVKFTYNGTYICQVKNPPDVHGTVGEIKLSVVATASFSGLLLLALAIAAAITGIVIILLIIASCRRCKRRRQAELEGNEEAPRKERKNATACHPSRAVHPYLSDIRKDCQSRWHNLLSQLLRPWRKKTEARIMMMMMMMMTVTTQTEERRKHWCRVKLSGWMPDRDALGSCCWAQWRSDK